MNECREAGGGTGDEIVTGDKRTDEDFTLRVDGKATFNTISMNESFWGGATESRTLDKAGKVTARDTNNDSAADYTPTYNDANMLTADGRHYTYTYDMLGRVVTAKDSTATTTIKEYKWDPACTLLAWREDVSVPADGLDGSDAWYYSAASAEGQAKATIRGSDTDAKELYVYHAAGVGGRSGDKRVIVRDVHGNGHMAGYGNGGTDAAKWGDAATGTFTHRYYALYDAEGNLTHVKTSGGMTVERWQHNRGNRVPTQLFVTDVADDAGNTGANGGTNEGDYNAFFAADGYFNGASVKTDFDQDGDADTADYNRFMDTFFEAPAQGRAAGSVFKMVYLAAGQMYDDTLSGPTDPSTMTLTARTRWVGIGNVSLEISSEAYCAGHFTLPVVLPGILRDEWLRQCRSIVFRMLAGRCDRPWVPDRDGDPRTRPGPWSEPIDPSLPIGPNNPIRCRTCEWYHARWDHRCCQEAQDTGLACCEEKAASGSGPWTTPHKWEWENAQWECAGKGKERAWACMQERYAPTPPPPTPPTSLAEYLPMLPRRVFDTETGRPLDCMEACMKIQEFFATLCSISPSLGRECETKNLLLAVNCKECCRSKGITTQFDRWHSCQQTYFKEMEQFLPSRDLWR